MKKKSRLASVVIAITLCGFGLPSPSGAGGCYRTVAATCYVPAPPSQSCNYNIDDGCTGNERIEMSFTTVSGGMSGKNYTGTDGQQVCARVVPCWLFGVDIDEEGNAVAQCELNYLMATVYTVEQTYATGSDCTTA